jgi:hypothetical protein
MTRYIPDMQDLGCALLIFGIGGLQLSSQEPGRTNLHGLEGPRDWVRGIDSTICKSKIVLSLFFSISSLLYLYLYNWPTRDAPGSSPRPVVALSPSTATWRPRQCGCPTPHSNSQCRIKTSVLFVHFFS